jgi:hypothetical protein
MISIPLSNDKTPTFYPWKGKQKRLVQEAIQSNNLNLSSILVEDMLQDQNIYLNEAEINYCFLKMRQKYLDNSNIEAKFICPECLSTNTANIESDVLFESVKLWEKGQIEVEGKTFVFDCPSYATQQIKQMLKDTPNAAKRSILEMIFYIQGIYENGEKLILSPEEIAEMLDNLDINNYNKIYEYYKTLKFSFKPILKLHCEHCEHVEETEMDVLPNFEKEWL